MMYDLYIEKQRADIDQKLSIQLSFSIDDIMQFGNRNTSFSKSITLPGTARNNKLFGHILSNTSANPTGAGDNILANFDVTTPAVCEIRQSGLLIIKGIFRLTRILFQNGSYSYEGVVFGELGGFASAISNGKLEDLDFSEYNHTLTAANIVASWDNAGGSGYYYPLIDYGTFSTDKVDYDFKTFRPALYVKEYIDKIFQNSGYTFQSAFLETDLFKSIIVPNNTKNLERIDNVILTAGAVGKTITASEFAFDFDTASGGNFIISGSNDTFTWNSTALLATFTVDFIGQYTCATDPVNVQLIINGLIVDNFYLTPTVTPKPVPRELSWTGVLNTGDQLRLAFTKEYLGVFEIELDSVSLSGTTDPPTRVIVDVTEQVKVNDVIPRGILQRDFIAWVTKMFNLYIDEDKLTEKELLIEPFIDYYDYSDRLDWSQKIDYSKTLDITPMGQLNGRFFEFKYKQDNDFYNEGYQKKYNQSYGDILYDTGFPFSKDKQTVEVGFSPSPLVRYAGTDKVVTAIYKKSKGNDIDQEELTDSNIRILFAKKITGVTSWDILDGVSSLSSQTVYGYAGHLNDPDNSTADLNFGAPSEIYFTVELYTSNGLFNVYWNSYIQEIANKDSKILSCHAYLKSNDIADLDFSKPIYISGTLWRINKIEDYDAENPVTRVELLKIINADNG